MSNFQVCFKSLCVSIGSAMVLSTSAITEITQVGNLLTNSLVTTQDNITIIKGETQSASNLFQSFKYLSTHIIETTLPNNIERVGCITTPSGLMCW